MALKSWLEIPRGSHFSLANLPFGIISHSDGAASAAAGAAGAENPSSGSSSPSPSSLRPAVAIGELALDLQVFTAKNGFKDLGVFHQHSAVFAQPSLNAFAALGRPMHTVVRKYLQSVFLDATPYPEILKDNPELQRQCLFPRSSVTLHVPMYIRDYTDFYAGLNHAYNCGVIFRGPDNALQPNYKYLPVGYHGRASSVVVSGTDIKRPSGQILENPAAEHKVPTFSPCKKLDIELELGAFVCKPSEMGSPIPIGQAEDYLFGVVLMNDWSARDIQAWEYVPLGPFNSKNFGTSVSAWVVLADALEPFKTAALHNDVQVLDYLREDSSKNVYDIKLEVDLTTSKGNTTTISRTSSKNLLFSFPQMLAHHSVTGCPFNVGDLLGSGTISGTEPTSCGSLLEQNKSGKQTIKLAGGEERTFLEDGDTVTLRGVCGDDPDALVGFGECRGRILPPPPAV